MVLTHDICQVYCKQRKSLEKIATFRSTTISHESSLFAKSDVRFIVELQRAKRASGAPKVLICYFTIT